MEKSKKNLKHSTEEKAHLVFFCICSDQLTVSSLAQLRLRAKQHSTGSSFIFGNNNSIDISGSLNSLQKFKNLSPSLYTSGGSGENESPVTGVRGSPEAVFISSSSVSPSCQFAK